MTEGSAQRVTLWDPLVRVGHWWLALVFFANYFFTEEGETWHQWLGYSAVAVVALRFLWGFIGPRAARWSDFLPTPSRLMTHLSLLRKGEYQLHPGHSPIGALVMILMLSCILGLGVTGYMMEEVDRYWGVEWVETVHDWVGTTLAILVAFHITAALYLSYRLRENLPLSMITGKRKISDEEPR